MEQVFKLNWNNYFGKEIYYKPTCISSHVLLNSILQSYSSSINRVNDNTDLKPTGGNITDKLEQQVYRPVINFNIDMNIAVIV